MRFRGICHRAMLSLMKRRCDAVIVWRFWERQWTSRPETHFNRGTRARPRSWRGNPPLLFRTISCLSNGTPRRCERAVSITRRQCGQYLNLSSLEPIWWRRYLSERMSFVRDERHSMGRFWPVLIDLILISGEKILIMGLFCGLPATLSLCA